MNGTRIKVKLVVVFCFSFFIFVLVLLSMVFDFLKKKKCKPSHILTFPCMALFRRVNDAGK